MTNLDLYTGLPQQPASPSLTLWADEARQAATVASSLAPTPFVPQSLRATRASRDESDQEIVARTAANITAAILTGAELGLTPMAALRSVVVIQGTPAMTAVALRGLVQSKGHEMWVESSSDTRAVVCGRRRGTDTVERAVWTIDRARQLGLTSKDNWRKQPESMLVARGTSEVCRRIAADVLLGLPYSAEELRDDAVESEPQRTARRRAKAEPAPLPEPDLDESAGAVSSQEESESEPTSTEEDPITPKQLTALNAALSSDLGLSDRDAKLSWLSTELRRDLASSKEITKAEAMRLLDVLAAIREVQPEPTPAEPDLESDGWPVVATIPEAGR